MSCACVRWTTISSAVSASKSVALRIRQSSVCLRVNKSTKTNRHTSVVLSLPFEVTTSHLQVILLLLFVWMLLAECSESISHNHTAHIKKCPDSIVGKRQRPPSLLNLFIRHQHGHRHMAFSITISTQRCVPVHTVSMLHSPSTLDWLVPHHGWTETPDPLIYSTCCS